MPAPNLEKSQVRMFHLALFLLHPKRSCARETTRLSQKQFTGLFLLGRVIPNTVVKTYFSDNTWRSIDDGIKADIPRVKDSYVRSTRLGR